MDRYYWKCRFLVIAYWRSEFLSPYWSLGICILMEIPCTWLLSLINFENHPSSSCIGVWPPAHHGNPSYPALPHSHAHFTDTTYLNGEHFHPSYSSKGKWKSNDVILNRKILKQNLQILIKKMPRNIDSFFLWKYLHEVN